MDPEDRYRFLYALASFTDPALVRRTMELALGPDVRSQDAKLVIARELRNEAARDLAWDVLRERWDAVQKKTGEFVGNTVIVSALSSFCDARRADEIKAFFKRASRARRRADAVADAGADQRVREPGRGTGVEAHRVDGCARPVMPNSDGIRDP